MEDSIKRMPEKTKIEKNGSSLLEKLWIPATLIMLTAIYFANKAYEKKQREILDNPKSTIEFYVNNESEFIDIAKKYAPKGISWEKTAVKDLKLNGLSAFYITKGKYKFYVYEK
jgi:hypothetical protein